MTWVQPQRPKSFLFCWQSIPKPSKSNSHLVKLACNLIFGGAYEKSVPTFPWSVTCPGWQPLQHSIAINLYIYTLIYTLICSEP